MSRINVESECGFYYKNWSKNKHARETT